jgi:hypothetical protein
MSSPEDLNLVAHLLPAGQPISYAVYGIDTAQEVVDAYDGAKQKVTPEQWSVILDRFNDETDNLWGALWEAFVEIIREEVPEVEA